MSNTSQRHAAYLLTIGLCLTAQADVSLPNIFGDHMVLQREQANPVWGNANAREAVTVEIDQQSHSTLADDDGKWRVLLDPLDAGGPYTLKVTGNNSLSFEDVLVGEVWFCSGQSNMQFELRKMNHADVELATASNSQIRLITIAKDGTQEPKENFEGQWEVSTAESAVNFSGVGYLFGKRIQNALNVPVGLIDNSWGASTAEAWVPREALEGAGIYNELLKSWDVSVAAYLEEVAAYKAWEAKGKPDSAVDPPKDPRYGQRRPANIYNGMVHPLAGYGIRGVIWYQGESNARRAFQYRELFPLMITTWRDLWQQGDFSFYWVQLADHTAELSEPADSYWAELREAQTMTLSLRNTGQAVIIDAGEGRDIHPRDKQTVANRLVRHALVKDYGYDIACESPHYASMEVEGNAVTLSFDDVSTSLYAFDTKEVLGFSIAGEDQDFVWAQAEIVGRNQVKVFSELVSDPVAVRYAWADNPIANLYDRKSLLPVTPFRTDNWKGLTTDSVK